MKTCRGSIQPCVRIRTRTTNLLATVITIAFLAAGARADTTTCTTGQLPNGNGGDLIVSGGTCTVAAGTYQYHNVNIISGGTLLFTDANIDFWAESILVENTGSLIAGSTTAPIGTAGGHVAFHLWGVDEGTNGHAQGIVCQTPTSDTVGPCGVPMGIWTSNVSMEIDPTSCVSNSLPGGVTDCFYQYMPIDYDGGGDPPGYFGYKVLALSYGGTLQLFGKKGATYGAVKPSDSGTSWARLAGNLSPGNSFSLLYLDRFVDWQKGDQIVVSTTDYLPGHSELLTIKSVSTNHGLTVLTTTPAVYSHNGTTFDTSLVPAGVGPDQDTSIKCSAGQTRCVETRAAVGLLSRSIRIISGGDTPGSPFPDPSKCQSGAPPVCSKNPQDCYFFGGDTIVRQGFQSYQVQGVEFYQLGQGGRIMHYPVHFHMARQTPVNTYVADSSVWDSMTRWYTIHATSGVTLARNVGFLSIGHGYYLEDGTETDNKLFGNLGVFARSAIVNPQNPRCVPGILAATEPSSGATDQIPYSTDVDHPTPYWIMNGWNDFQYNTASGAGGCGMCYWLTPGGNSGYSRYQYWGTGYAAEQQVDTQNRYGTTPLKRFVGNSCVSSQNAFFTIGQSVQCFGLVSNGDSGAPLVPRVSNPLAPGIGTTAAENYYPMVNPSQGRYPTLCPPDLDCSSNSAVPTCAAGSEQNCAVTAIDHFTTSFNWADTGFAALWLRPQWYLLSNSAITDVQNGGVTFVSGGGYGTSDEIPGYWALAHKNVFIGSTQPGNPLALNAGPFNPNSQLKCALRTDNGAPEAAYCLNPKEGISMQLENFAVNQRLFNIYDGPSFQDSDAYLNINETTLSGCTPGQGATCQSSGWMYGNSLGVPLDSKANTCYLPNAAIAWKQPNGFYYPPEFHSKNLFFNNVDIRHFVIEPLFQPGTYSVNTTLTADRYCVQNSAMFNGFTDVDRQTELSDDDGSLTGLLGPAMRQAQQYLPTISVNKDNFFNAPVETVECASDIADNMPQPWGTCSLSEPLCGTANTSPYEYVTSVVFPCANGSVPPACTVPVTNWDETCTQPNCFGVPLYREGLVPADDNAASFIRMAGQAVYQRSSLTVNNGSYYMDTGASLTTQNNWAVGPDINVFTAAQIYNVFLLYAKETTVQAYSLYVGTDFTPSDPTQLWVTRADKDGPFQFMPQSSYTIVECSSLKPGTDFAWCYDFDQMAGILTVHMNMNFSDFKQNYAQAIEEHCQPQSYCTWNPSSNSCGCALSSNDQGYKECQNACSNWATKSIDCPWDSSDFTGGATGGCYGFGVQLPNDFMASDQMPPAGQCLPDDPTWNVMFKAALPATARKGCFYTRGKLPTGSFCSSRK